MSWGYSEHDPQWNSLLRSVQGENSAGKLLGPSELLSWERPADLQSALDSVTVLIFEAPIVSANLFSVSPERGGMQHVHYHHVRVAGAELDAGTPAAVLDSLVPNLKQHIWSCFLRADAFGEGDIAMFVMIVEWVNETTARRIGSLDLCYAKEQVYQQNKHF
jgi:hypothetical protein